MENTSGDDDHRLFPEDVLIEILVFLPVISLLRFKSVCKSWRALIESSLFIDLHINTLPPDNSFASKIGTFICQTTYSYLGGTKSDVFMLSGGGGGGGGVDEEEVKLEDLCFPTCYKVSPSCTEGINIVGSCNGLICIHGHKQRDVSLWNPATRQFRLLPKSLTLAGVGNLHLHEDFVAFGYDVKTKDYKVVQISSFRPYMPVPHSWIPIEEHTFRVQVYNLSTDSWRLLEGINSFPALPYQAIFANHGVYLNGRYYFLGAYFIDDEVENTFKSRRMILSFDFTKEIFTTMRNPDEYGVCTILTTYVGEKLAVFAQVRVIDENGFYNFDISRYEIWVLNEHDVKESWTKVHSIGPYFLGNPRGISNNGEFVLIATKGRHRGNNGVYVRNNRLQLFNLHTKEVTEDFRTEYQMSKTFVYKQSLVSVG